MKAQEIIERLCRHEISKGEAINQIDELINGLRKRGSLEFTVEESGFTSENNHGFLKLKLPYAYSEMIDIKKGDKVDLMPIP
jgi:hypothetical protein